MLEVFRHKDNDDFYYTRYSGDIDGEHAHANWRFFHHYIQEKGEVHYITEYEKGFNLVDRDFISLMAEYALQYEDRITDSYIFGFGPIYRFFWRTFLSISRTSFKRKVVGGRADVETQLSFTFEDNFERIFVYPEPKA